MWAAIEMGTETVVVALPLTSCSIGTLKMSIGSSSVGCSSARVRVHPAFHGQAVSF